MIGKSDEDIFRGNLIERISSIDKDKLKIMVDTFFFIFSEKSIDDIIKKPETKGNRSEDEQMSYKLKSENTGELDNVLLNTKVVNDHSGRNRKEEINNTVSDKTFDFGIKSEIREHKCSQCNFTFMYEKSLYTHMNETHSRNPKVLTNLGDETVLKCTLGQCNETFSSNTLHEKHLETAHFNIEQEQVFPALVAKAEAKMDHPAKVESAKGPKEIKCDFCDFEFNVTKSNYKLITHLKSFHFNKDINTIVEQLESEDKKVVCNICGEKLRSSQSLVSHMKLMHTDLKMAPCHICGKLLKQHDSIISTHMQTHNQDGFPCQHCGIVLRSKRSHKDHQTVHMTDVEKVKCDECDLQFDRKNYLYKHKQKIHSNKSPELKSCDDCGKMFSSVSKLKLHISSVHFHEKPFSCNLCEYKTGRKDNLSTHRKGVHGEEEYCK